MTDYTKLVGADLLHECNDDGRKWAEAFVQHFPECGIDEDIVFGWFANAIERAWDYRTGTIHNGDHMEYEISRARLMDAGREDPET